MSQALFADPASFLEKYICLTNYTAAMDSLLKQYVEANGPINSKILGVGLKKSSRKNRTLNAKKVKQYLEQNGIRPEELFEPSITAGALRLKLGNKADQVWLELEEAGCVDEFKIEWFTYKAAP